MKDINDFHTYVLEDLFGSFPDITSKRMFGGYGYYYKDAIFAIVTSESELYFKVDETNQKQFEDLGSQQFVYTGHTTKKPTPMPYWLLPEEIMEEKEKLFTWIKQSAAISKKNKK